MTFPKKEEPVLLSAAKNGIDVGSSRACAPIVYAATPHPEAPPGAAPSAASIDDLMGQIRSPNAESTASTAIAFAKLNELARSDPAALKDLIRRHSSQTDEATKAALASLLSSFPSLEVTDSALKLARGDAAQRKDAYDLLGKLPSADARASLAIRQALETEKDPAALSRAVAALKSTSVAEPVQNQAILARLGTLTRDSDPIVRSESLRALAQLDKAGDIAEPSVYQMLTDQNPDLRTDALFAIAGSQLKSDRIKTALINLLRDTGETPDSRFMALRAVERFPMTDAEYATYSQSDAALNAGYLNSVLDRTSPEITSAPRAGGAIFSPFGK
ncbi:hypothetical protein SAMN03159339_6826 [Variovorax sp. 770b2]|nr:hypothetical protein SAMN03159339_6826 [Variovorax sp. 770b2]